MITEDAFLDTILVCITVLVSILVHCTFISSFMVVIITSPIIETILCLQMCENLQLYRHYDLNILCLGYLQQHQQLAMDANQSGCHHRETGYASEMPMALRVRPIQPNLQEAKQEQPSCCQSVSGFACESSIDACLSGILYLLHAYGCIFLCT